jgi:hypothetical protein
MEDETPDLDLLFDFLEPKINNRHHFVPNTNVYGVSFLNFFKVW